MARKQKLAIYIFCEGESEIAYAKFLKDHFWDVVAIQKPVKGGFEKALAKFKNNPKYRNNINQTDEIWFFIDVDAEQGDPDKWNNRLDKIKILRKLRKGQEIKVRLLMTTGCLEYWFCLHYEKLRPPIKTEPDKKWIENRLKKEVPNYEKGEADTTNQIAADYKTAVENGKWCLNQLRTEGNPRSESEDDVNQWLYQNTSTFTNVHEAIIFLQRLQED